MRRSSDEERHSIRPHAPCAFRARAALPVLLAISVAVAGGGRIDRTLEFALEMARKGNWREARFRWEQVERERSENPRLLNNLAVASEVLGDREAASRYYKRALALSEDSRIAENARRFRSLLRAAGETDESETPRPLQDHRKRRGKPRDGDALRVATRFRLPPRLDLSEYATVLVASFRTRGNESIDGNREITRFLRGALRKRSPLAVLDVVPAPAIPEQTVDDLLANYEFWRHLGQEYGADLVVSGIVSYDRRDTSGYQDVDVVSPVTGQKVRQTRFVEQERFTYSMEVFFLDGETGAVVHRDTMERSAIYPGASNDTLTAFYELVDSVAQDVLAVISPRTREDTRIVFRR